MIALAVFAWVLLVACGEYLTHEASFLDAWRASLRPGSLLARIVACWMCPWGWSAVPAGVMVILGAVAYSLEPWAVVPIVVVLLPALGLGLGRLVSMLSPWVAMQRTREMMSKRGE